MVSISLSHKIILTDIYFEKYERILWDLEGVSGKNKEYKLG